MNGNDGQNTDKHHNAGRRVYLLIAVLYVGFAAAEVISLLCQP